MPYNVKVSLGKGKNSNKKSTKSKSKSQSFEKKVLNVVKKNSEPLMSATKDQNDVIMFTFNTATNGLPTIYSFGNLYGSLITGGLSSINQGSAQGDRKGNEITLKSAPIHLIFSRPEIYNGTDTVAQACNFKLVFAKLKRGIEKPVLGDFQRMFQDGGLANPVANNNIDLFKPFNRDLWTIKKTVPFRLSNVDAESNLQPADGLGWYKHVYLDLAKYLPKTIKFDDDDGDTTDDITNAGLYMFLLGASGTPTNTSLEYARCQVSFSHWVEYYDM